MVHLAVQISKYFIIFLYLIYTFQSFWVLRYPRNSEQPKAIYSSQRRIILYIQADAFLVLYLTSNNPQMIGLYLMQFVLFLSIFILYNLFFKEASRLLLNNMCMLMSTGLIILTRLSFDKAYRQFVFMVAGLVLIMIFPAIIHGTKLFRSLTWLYAAVGILSLALVTIAGQTSYGAKLSLSFGGISIQPSEFVKIIFVFFLASILYRAKSFRDILIASMGAGVFVLVLVASKDLGSALLFFMTFLVMIYVSTKRFVFFGGGMLFMAVAFVLGYFAFSHVQARVIAWQDPIAVIDSQGYQVARSLFAIGTGGWLGLGINQGQPGKIPVVEKDFVFSAICQELGGVVAICIILICMSNFLMIFNISMQLKDRFYRLVALGLGTIYAMQVFLTIGGNIKFIPSTGVTLALISYGGSSLLSTMILFGIIQAMYLMQAKQDDLQKLKGRRGDGNGTEGTTKRTTKRTSGAKEIKCQ